MLGGGRTEGGRNINPLGVVAFGLRIASFNKCCIDPASHHCMQPKKCMSMSMCSPCAVHVHVVTTTTVN